LAHAALKGWAMHCSCIENAMIANSKIFFMFVECSLRFCLIDNE